MSNEAPLSGVRIVLGVTADISLNFLDRVPAALFDKGALVSVICAPGATADRFRRAESVHVITLTFKREISLFADIYALFKLIRIFGNIRPTLIDFGTPKAGLLGMVAGWMAGVPCRIYKLHGLRLETAVGWKRRVLLITERIACRLAHRVICVSFSLRQRAIDLKLVEAGKASVLASGSCNGVEMRRFFPSIENLQRANQMRIALDLPEQSLVIGFAGRFTRDKGIVELIDAFDELRCRYPELRLLLVGDYENGDPVPREIRDKIENDSFILQTGFVEDTAPYYHFMDVLVLPTYREGFPVVPLEAQAAGVPVVSTRATGAIDSVQDGKTGLLVPVGDASELACAIGSLLGNAEKRKEMGRRGQEWITQEFSGDRVRGALLVEYQRLLRERLGPHAPQNARRGWQGVVKRCFDLAFAAMGLAILWPVLGILAILIRASMGGPAFFRQLRPGIYGRPFTLLKFRTMNDKRDSEGHLLPDGERLTRLGRLLRASSLDELPQLWNVLRGQMSLVGPRPLLMEYLDRYTPEQARRHEVKPGITGWAQINGRNALTWEEKFVLDVWYVDHAGLLLDLWILWRTFLRLIRPSGISSQGCATMPEFFAGEKRNG